MILIGFTYGEIIMNKTFYIYQCIALRKDGTRIERIFKMPSFWNHETIAIALVTIGDAPGYITNIKIESDGQFVIIDQDENLSMDCGASFDELLVTDIKVAINYKDEISTVFNCKKIGEEVTNKKITRKTPVVISSYGYSRFTKEEFLAKEGVYPFYPEAYEKTENYHCERADKDMKLDYTYFHDCFFATIEDIIRKYIN